MHVLGGITELWLFLESVEVVINSEGRISWNVECSSLQGAGILGGGVDDESDGGAQVIKVNFIENGERT